MAESTSTDQSPSPDAHTVRIVGGSQTTTDEVAPTAASPTSLVSDSSHISRTPLALLNSDRSQTQGGEEDVTSSTRSLEDDREVFGLFKQVADEFESTLTDELESTLTDEIESTSTDELEYISRSFPIQISELFETVVCTNAKSYFESIAHTIRDAPVRRIQWERDVSILRFMGVSIKPSPPIPIMAYVTSNEYATDMIRDHHFRLNEPSGFQEPMRTSQFLRACTKNESKKAQSTVVKSMCEGFQNASFERSVRQNAKIPAMTPYWITGTEYALGKWTTRRMFDRMKTANQQLRENVAHLADPDSLEEARSILAGVSKLTERQAQLQFSASNGFGDTIRKFVEDCRQFLIEVVLNNALQDMVLPIQFNSEGAGILTTEFWDTHGCTEVVRVFTEKPQLHAFPDEPIDIKMHGSKIQRPKSIGNARVTDTPDSATQEPDVVPEPRGIHYDRNLRRREIRKVSKDLGASMIGSLSIGSLMQSSSRIEVAEHTERFEAATAEAFPSMGNFENNIESDDSYAVNQSDPALQTKSEIIAKHEIHELLGVSNQEENYAATSSIGRRSSGAKSNSMDSTKFTSESVLCTDLNSTISKLHSEASTGSMEESKNRRASLTRERRDSINLIRSRTASRVSNSGIHLQGPSSNVLCDAQGVLLYEQFVVNDVQGQNLGKNENSNADEQSVGLLPLSMSSLHSVNEELGSEDSKPTSNELVTPKKLGKWIAPLPEDQDWKTLDRVPGYALVPETTKTKSKKSKKKAGKSHGSITSHQSELLLNESTSPSQNYEMGTMESNPVEQGFDEKEKELTFLSQITQTGGPVFNSDATLGNKELRDGDAKMNPPTELKEVARSTSVIEPLVDNDMSELAFKSLMVSDPVHSQTSEPSLQTTASITTELNVNTTKDLIVDSEMPYQHLTTGHISSSASSVVNSVSLKKSNCPARAEMALVSEPAPRTWPIEAIMNDRLQYPQYYPYFGPIFRSHRRSKSAPKLGECDSDEEYFEEDDEDDEIQVSARPRSHSAMGQFP